MNNCCKPRLSKRYSFSNENRFSFQDICNSIHSLPKVRRHSNDANKNHTRNQTNAYFLGVNNQNLNGDLPNGRSNTMTPRMRRRNTKILKLSGGRRVRLRKVYFFWLCPNLECFEWFFDILSEIETGKPDLVDINVYLTRGWKLGKTTFFLSIYLSIYLYLYIYLSANLNFTYICICSICPKPLTRF